MEAKGIDLNENLEIKIVLKNLNYLSGTSEEKIKGRWVFEFTAGSGELTANSYARAVQCGLSGVLFLLRPAGNKLNPAIVLLPFPNLTLIVLYDKIK